MGVSGASESDEESDHKGNDSPEERAPRLGLELVEDSRCRRGLGLASRKASDFRRECFVEETRLEEAPPQVKGR